MRGSTRTRATGWTFLATVVAGFLLGFLFVGGAHAATDGSGSGLTLTSDKADYVPGETVTLAGSGWQPGEAVHIVVNDDQGRTWTHEADVVADDAGNVVDQFQLPGWFVAVYAMTATGPSSGTVTSSFTDAALKATIDSAVPTLLGPSNAFTDVTWHASANGTYSVRVAGSSCTTGTQLDSGNYTTTPSTVTTRVSASALAEGANTIRVCVTVGTNTDFDTQAVTKDTTAPVAPTISSTSPASPANNTAPKVIGSAETGSTVKLYTNPTCTSAVAASGTAAAFASGLTVTVSANSSTTFYATATDAAGNTSVCSTSSVTYVADSIPPGSPSLTATSPVSPANNNAPKIIGDADPGSTVKLYTNATCTSAVAATGTAAAFASPGLAVSVGSTSTTTFYATATDSAGNASACSTSSITYSADATAPARPTFSSTSPASPANNTAPSILGAAEAGSTVRLYINSTCTSAVAASGSAAAFASPGLSVSVGDNSSTPFYATAMDAAGNVSPCSTSTITYVEDSTPPVAPTVSSTSPASPANNMAPKITGSAEAGSTVKLYTNATCTSAVAGSGTAAAFGTGITVSVADNSTTTFYATATDAAGNTSVCSTTSVTYVEDSVAPAAPTVTATSPLSPANNNAPKIIGDADPGSTVKLYTNATCTSAVAATGTAAAFASPGLAVSVGNNSTTIFYATATDSAGNASACSTSSITYVADASAPARPTLSSTSPASPANDNFPEILGSAEGGSTVKLYTNSTCTSALVTSGSAAAFGAPGLTVTVADGATTTFWATATDAAGNVSPCSSTSVTYVEDSTPPVAPTVSSTSPASPANNVAPKIIGSAEAGSTVKLYTNATCTSAVAATGTAAAFAAGLTVSVGADTTTTFYATATDAAGNVSACSSSSVTYVADATAPTAPTVTSSSPASPANNSAPKLIGSAEAGSTVKLYTNATCTSAIAASGTAAAFASPGLTVSVAANTTASFYATATDAAGNVSACSTSPFVYVDDATAPLRPTISATSPASPANDNFPEVLGSAEAGSTVKLYTNATCTSAIAANGSAAAFVSPGLTVSVADDSTTSFYATATDAAGNVSPCSTSTVSYVEDSTPPAPPTLTGTSPASPANVNAPKILGSAAGASTVSLYTNAACTSAVAASGTPAALASPGLTVSVADDSTTSFFATAADAVGNVSACSASSVSYVEDSTAPNTALDSAPTNPSHVASPTFTFSSSETGSTFQCRLDAAPGDPFTDCASPDTIGPLGDGTHTFEVRARDTAGNVDATAASSTWLLDTQKPSSGASSPAYSTSGTVTVSYSAADTGSGLDSVELWAKAPGEDTFSKVATDGAPAATGSFSYTASGDGSYSFYTVAVDKAANREASPAAGDTSTLVDTNAPSSAASSPEYDASGTIAVGYAASDSGSGLDAVELWAKGPGDAAYGKVATDTTPGATGSFHVAATEGRYDFYTRARDKAGNAEAAPPAADSSTLVDLSAPTSAASTPAFSTSTTITVSYSAGDGGSGLDTVDLWVKAPGDTAFGKVATDSTASATGTFTYSAGGDGSYAFYTVARDKAGNAEAAPAEADSTTLVDTQAPSSAASAPLSSTSTTIAVAYTASDSGSGLDRVELWAAVPGTSGFGKVATDTTPSASGSFDYSAAAGDGTYGFYTVAVDKAGNRETDPAAADTTTLLDTEAPSSSASSPAYSTSTTIAVSGSASDSGSGVDKVELWAKAPGAPGYTQYATSAGGSFSYTATAGDGDYRFYTVATDKAGNREADATSADSTTLLDTGAPSSLAASAAYSTSTTVDVSYTASDGGSGLGAVELWARVPGATGVTKVATDSTPGAAGSFGYTATDGDGSYAFFTVAVDKAGNREADPAGADTTTFVDTQAPSSNLTPLGAPYTNSTHITLGFGAGDSGSGAAEVQLWVKAPGENGFSKVATTTYRTFGYDATAGDGTYSFYSIAVDRAGNVESAPAEPDTAIFVDTAAPLSAASAPAYSTSTTINVGYTASDSGSSVKSVELWAKAPGESSFSKVATGTSGSFDYQATAGDGSYGFYTVAIDNAGNAEAAPADADTTTLLDTAGPTSSATSSTYSASTTIAVGYNAADPGASASGLHAVELWAKAPGDSAFGLAATTTGGAGSFDYTAAAGDGAYAFYTVAVDEAGNREAAPGTADTTTLLDTGAPSSSATSPATSNSTTITVPYSDGDTGSGVDSVELWAKAPGSDSFAKVTTDTTAGASFSYAALAGDGTYSFYTVAVDRAGNREAAPAGADSTTVLDTGAPISSATSPASSTSTTITVSYIAADSGSGVASVELWANRPGELGYGKVATYTAPLGTGSFSYLATGGDGTYSFYTVAVDAAGNAEGVPAAADATTLLDTSAAASSATSPQFSKSTALTVSYSAFDAGASASGLDSVELWAQAPGATAFAKVATAATPTATGSFDYTAGSDGAYAFYTVAVDKAGNREDAPASADTTTLVDTVAPGASITARPDDPTADAAASFGFGASDAAPSSGGLRVECSLDGAEFAPCASPQDYTGLVDGPHTFRVRATDNAGNTGSSPASVTWTVDTVAPSTALVSHPSDPSASSSAAFEFDASDASPSSGGIHFECALDGGALDACASGKSYSNLADGSHTVSVQARDAAGNVDATPATFTWSVDTVAPKTSIGTRPSDPTASSSASFTFSASDASPSSGGVHFECSLDGGGYEGCESPKRYDGLVDGTHTLRVRATDAAGNVDSTPTSFTWLVDTTAPDTSITSSPSDPTATGAASFAFTGTDPTPSSGGVHFECKLDGGDFSPCTSSKDYNLADGSHTFSVRAIDAVGNTDASPATSTWIVDTVAPDTTITGRPADPSTSSSASFAFTGADPTPSSGGLHFECKLDGGDFSPCASSKDYNVADGQHTFAVRAVDKAGNSDSTPAAVAWFVDTVAPDTTITGHPADQSPSSTATFTFTASDAAPSSGGIHFECKLDGGDFSPCTSSKSYTLADGTHTFQVRAADRAGNADATPASSTWTVDTIAPETTIGSTPRNPSTTTDASFAFASNETGATFQCSLDGATFAACPQSYSGLAQGSHTFRVRATDRAGNTDLTPASYTWTIDSIAPDTTITSTQANPTTATTTSFTFTASEAATFQCSLDGAAFASCTSPQAYNGLLPATHTFQVRATDTAGNVDATPASVTWLVQAIPTVTATAPTGTGVSVFTNPTATFSRAMDATTLTTSSFTLTPSGGAPVAATISCNTPCTTAMLTPSTRLANGTTYTAQVGTAVKSSEGVPLASPVSWTFTTTSAPEALSKSPADGAANVPTGSSAGTPISATFTKPMNGNTFTTSTFTLWRPDNTQVPATPSFNSATGTATITPTLPLSYGTTYTVKLTNGITDANGIALASPVSWAFTTTATMMAPLRINSGSTSNYTDSFGNSWLADDYFKNGLTESIPTRTIKATGFDPALFRDDRYGSSSTTLWSYNIPVPNGTYDIKLYFVELTKTAIGQRVFSVDITDTAVNPDIANLDIFKEVGANAADVKTFTGVTISDSTVSLRSINVTDLPEIAAIEIIPVHT